MNRGLNEHAHSHTPFICGILFILMKSYRYDIHDVRSITYDTLRLAIEEKNAAFAASQRRRLNEDEELPQSSLGDITYWIYEAKTDDGLFTAESVASMYEAEATIIGHSQYNEYCHLDYGNTTEDAEDAALPQCKKPLSAMNIFYASSWDADLAEEIITALTPENIEMYNALSPCVEFELDLFCDQLPDTVTDQMKAWVASMNIKIETMVATWDGKGKLNEDVEQVTKFMAYLNELRTKANKVNFFFDANFNIANPVSMYSRSIHYWGQLLNGTDTETQSEEKLKQ